MNIIDLTPDPVCLHLTTYSTTIDKWVAPDDAIPYRVEQCAHCPMYYDAATDEWYI